MDVVGAAVPPDDVEEHFILPPQSPSSSEDEEEEEGQEQEVQHLPMTQNMEFAICTLVLLQLSCATANVGQEPVHAPFDPAINLANCIKDSTYSELNLTVEEHKEIRNSCGKTKRHMNQGQTTLDRFFDMIHEHHEALMQYLLEDVPGPDGLSTQKQFFDIVPGEKSEAKYQILNHCLVLFAYKWRKNVCKHKTL